MSISDRLVGAEPTNAPGNLDELEASLREAVTEGKPPADKAKPADKQATDAVERPDWIEEKFWTGNLEESKEKQAKAYKPLQSAYGRMANDLGTQRKFTDQILALDKRSRDLGDPTIPARTPIKVDPAKLVNNPTETLDELLTAREAAQRQEREAAQAKADLEAQERAFASKHPDFQDLIQSSEFADFVKNSPTRSRVAQAAARGDYLSADALLDEFKSHKKVAAAAADAVNANGVEAARKAGLETAAQARGEGNPGSKRVYRRAELIELKLQKPHLYSDPSFQDEIMKAYREGRVK